MYRQTTQSITVEVTPEFLSEQSSATQRRYFWAYHIRIDNSGEQTVQLLDRYWKITDGAGRIQEVRGAGVVGEQPVLRPGESFTYSSGTPLDTPSGFMVGSYRMVDEQGRAFDVAVPAFSLDSPEESQPVH